MRYSSTGTTAPDCRRTLTACIMTSLASMKMTVGGYTKLVCRYVSDGASSSTSDAPAYVAPAEQTHSSVYLEETTLKGARRFGDGRAAPDVHLAAVAERQIGRVDR